jgi:hypothetical protein
MAELKEFVRGDCGAPNPAVRLAQHFTRNNGVKQAVQDFDVDSPSTFCMAELLPDVGHVAQQSAFNTGPGNGIYDTSLHTSWTQEFINENQRYEDLQQVFHTVDFRTNPQVTDFASGWNAEESETGMLQRSARELTRNVTDPKLTGTQFMKFVQEVSNGHNVMQFSDGASTNSMTNADWNDEFLQSGNIPWVQEAEFNKPVSSNGFMSYRNCDPSVEFNLRKIDVVAHEWLEEFVSSSGSAVVPPQDFRQMLQHSWDEQT